MTASLLVPGGATGLVALAKGPSTSVDGWSAALSFEPEEFPIPYTPEPESVLPALPDPLSAAAEILTFPPGTTEQTMKTAPLKVRLAVAAEDEVSVSVRVLDPEVARGLTPIGAAFEIDLGSAQSADGFLGWVEVDYGEFSLGYRAGVSERLRALRGTGCVEVATLACLDVVPVEATNDLAAETLTFAVTEDAAAGTTTIPAPPGALNSSGFFGAFSGGGSYFAIGSGPAGPSGDFAATPMSAVASYQVGLFTGSLQTSYPIPLPPAAAGPTPSVVLSYDSGAVDGMNTDTNNQPGWAGIGWSYEPGSIRRTFKPCSTSQAVGDLCPAGDIYHLSLNGVSSRLVNVGGNEFRLESDPMWKITRRFDATNNGDRANEWWQVITTDGTIYKFGDTERTALQVPIYSIASDGYNWCSGSSNGVCDAVYQWNLRLTVDVHNNQVAYSYTEDENWFQTRTGTAFGNRKRYERDAQIHWIQYGRQGNTTGNARVMFDTQNRCVGSCDKTVPADWPDTPWDLECTDDATDSCTQESATFWSSKRLGAIRTQVWDGAWTTVDRYEFSYDYSTPPLETDGDKSFIKQFLKTAKRVSPDGAEQLPPTTFGIEWKDNRTNHPAGVSAMTMPRIGSIQNELGGLTSFTYGKSHNCNDDWDPEAWGWNSNLGNVRRPCDSFPGYDAYTGNGGSVFWNKWKVLSSTQAASHGNPAVTTTYSYLEPPMYAHDDNPLYGNCCYWNDFRGHRQVAVTVGTSGRRMTTEYTYYQGMDGDQYQSSGGTYNESFLTTDDVNNVDHKWLTGRTAEVRTLSVMGASKRNLSGESAPIARTITTYHSQETVAGKGTRFSAPSRVRSYTSEGPTLYTITKYQYDAYGNAIGEELRGNETGGTSKPDDNLFVERLYVQNLNKNILGLVKEERLHSGNDSSGALLAKARYYYDNQGLNDAPVEGLLTTGRLFYGTGGGEYSDTAFEHDSRGRVTATVDPTGVRTTYTYTTLGLIGTTTVVNPAGDNLTTTYAYDTAGRVTSITDPNGATTSATYDTMGRVASVRNPLNTSPWPDVTYIYRPDLADPYVYEKMWSEGENRRTYTFVDGFGRTYEVQSHWYDGSTEKRSVTRHDFDSHGRPFRSSEPDARTGAPAPTPLEPGWGSIDRYTQTSYDEFSRPQVIKQMTNGAAQRQTSLAHSTSTADGEARWVTTETDPLGRVTTRYTDAFGRLRKVTEPESLAATYTYDPAGNLESVADASGMTISSMTYDMAGRKVAMSDVNLGNWTYTYDKAGRLVQQMSPEPQGQSGATTITLDYDALGRLTNKTAHGASLASYTYYETGSNRGRLYERRAPQYIERFNKYDAVGNPTDHQIHVGGWGLGTWYYFDDTNYDKVGRPTSVALPAAPGRTGETLTYTYGNDGGVATMAVGATTLVDAVRRDPAGRLVERKTGADYRNVLYDSLGRPSELRVGTTSGGAQVQRLMLSFDDADNITSVRDRKNADQRECFVYDGADRLTRAYTKTGTVVCDGVADSTGAGAYNVSYSYDDQSRLVSIDGRPLTYGASSYAPTTYRGRSFAYDAAGNRASMSNSAGTTSYTYDRAQRLTKLDSPDGITQFGWGPDDGQLIWRRDPDGTVTHFVGGVLEVEYSASGDVTERFGFTHDGQVVAQRTRTATSTDTWYVFGDHVGSPAVSRNGGVTVRRWWGPYGTQRASTGTVPGNDGYTGHDDLTADTGLVWMRARFYDPVVGVFTQPDTIIGDLGDPRDLNRYGYVRGNPVKYTDPSGHVVKPGALFDGGTCNNPHASGCGGQAGHDMVNQFHAAKAELGGDWGAASKVTFESDAAWSAAYHAGATEWTNTKSGYGSGWMGPVGVVLLVVVSLTHIDDAIELIGCISGDAWSCAGAAAGIIPFGDTAVTSARVADGAQDAIKVSEKRLNHVRSRHTSGGRQTAWKSVFHDGEDLSGLISASDDLVPLRQANGNYARVVDARRSVGVDRHTGLPTDSYTIITDADNALVTMFPGYPTGGR